MGTGGEIRCRAIVAALLVGACAACGSAQVDTGDGTTEVAVLEAAARPGMDQLPDEFLWESVGPVDPTDFSALLLERCHDPVDGHGLSTERLVGTARSDMWAAAPVPTGPVDRGMSAAGLVAYEDSAAASAAYSRVDGSTLMNCLEQQIQSDVAGRGEGEGPGQLISTDHAGDLSLVQSTSHELDLGDDAVLFRAKLPAEVVGGLDHTYGMAVAVVRSGPTVVTVVSTVDNQGLEEDQLVALTETLADAVVERVGRVLDGESPDLDRPKRSDAQRVEDALAGGMVTPEDLSAAADDCCFTVAPPTDASYHPLQASPDSWEVRFHDCADLVRLSDGTETAVARRESPLLTGSSASTPLLSTLSIRSSVHIFGDESAARQAAGSVSPERFTACLEDLGRELRGPGAGEQPAGGYWAYPMEHQMAESFGEEPVNLFAEVQTALWGGPTGQSAIPSVSVTRVGRAVVTMSFTATAEGCCPWFAETPMSLIAHRVMVSLDD